MFAFVSELDSVTCITLCKKLLHKYNYTCVAETVSGEIGIQSATYLDSMIRVAKLIKLFLSKLWKNHVSNATRQRNINQQFNELTAIIYNIAATVHRISMTCFYDGKSTMANEPPGQQVVQLVESCIRGS
jgi:hypothetical protein